MRSFVCSIIVCNDDAALFDYYIIMMGAVHHIVSVISYIIGVEIGGQIGVEIYRVHVRESMM